MKALRYVGLVFGIAFGFMLAASRLTDYDVIHAGLLFHSAYLYLLMGSTMGVAGGLLWLLERLRWQTPYGGPLTPRRVPVQPRHVWGGLIFGLGWAISGTCPAVSAAQLGSGTVLGLVVMAGLYVGILARDVSVRAGAPVGSNAPSRTAVPGRTAGGMG